MSESIATTDQLDDREPSMWMHVVGPIGSIVLGDLLKPWLAPSFVVGAISVASMLVAYPMLRAPRPRFGMYAFQSLLLSLYVVGLFYLASMILTPRFGPVAGWSPVAALFFVSLYWLPDGLRFGRDRSRMSFTKHLLIGIAFGALVAVIAYWQPGYFTR